MLDHLLLIGAGLVAGVLNVLAGGGSFLTLPALIFLGLPAGVANGTNRVAILLQNVVAVGSFRRYGVLEPAALLWAALPATAGAALGSWLALGLSDRSFQRLLAVLMLAVALGSLWSGGRDANAWQLRGPWRWPLLTSGFFLAGVYGGLVQAGVGFLILALTTAAGLDLVRGNAVKVLAILCLTGLALLLFAHQGKVQWLTGLELAVGTMAGGWLGARWTVLKGHRFVRRVVTAAMLFLALRLWWAA